MITNPRTEPVGTARAAAAREVVAALDGAHRIAITTHVNADGDGVGSEIALVHLLTALGKQVAIANPSPIPRRYDFLRGPVAALDRTGDAVRVLRNADLFLVLDIADLGRLGHLGAALAQRGIVTACIDHHLSPGSLPPGPRMVDAGAAATAELVYDLAVTAGWPITTQVAEALYVALLTDTGGFRFANTTPRALRVAASLLEHGVHPERVYEQIYATAPVGRLRLTADVLGTLVVEPEVGLSWLTVPAGAIERYETTADDLEGLAEMARSVQGTRLAMLFRPLANGNVKVSFRSVGDVDVAVFARSFGGGGHAKASGASLTGTLDEVQRTVLAAARRLLLEGAPG
jgi:bifunctional oligoribonuclease and PAP phosphatase NrnA